MAEPLRSNRETKPTNPDSDRRAAEAESSDLSDFTVVGVGASAGGLEAFSSLVEAIPRDSGMAYVLIQHLEPNHQSLLAGLLQPHTPMPVVEAKDGMRIESDRVYVIPPKSYLSVTGGVLNVTPPRALHGARLPIDRFLNSLAECYGDRSACVILSGTGADGCGGLKSVKETGGLVIAQKPATAAYEEMPRSAIQTGAVDLILPIGEIPDALVTFSRRVGRRARRPIEQSKAEIDAIIDLLRLKTPHDFTDYKRGTLARRIERRMGICSDDALDMKQYLEMLEGDELELAVLAKELLINVTEFFRDPGVFEYLEQKIVPDLVNSKPAGGALRVWVEGCSTGEEAYSLAILFLERIALAKNGVKIQIFASDVDADAVTAAREGLFPKSIERVVSPERLSRFFTMENDDYRVGSELRSAVVFSVHDVLFDPPFSRIDFVSCRNLLIYLQPEAQAKVLSLFHFALREGGILLLGTTEYPESGDIRYSPISVEAHVHRHIGTSRPGEFLRTLRGSDHVQSIPSLGNGREPALAELTRKLVLQLHAPASVLIGRNDECLFFVGSTDRFIGPKRGRDVYSAFPEALHGKLRSGIAKARREGRPVIVQGLETISDGRSVRFDLNIHPATEIRDDLLLLSFLQVPKRDAKSRRQTQDDAEADGKPERRAIDTTVSDLEDTVRNLEMARDEAKWVNEDALSVNEELQATNEELMTSKEELQSLNEELTALNVQLEESLTRQRRTASDLENVLYSTDVATIFLDPDLAIRFYTPASTALMNLIPSDIGRPVTDLRMNTKDENLIEDVRTVLAAGTINEREIESESGDWYLRRVLPYRTADRLIDGVVLTFTTITDRKHAADALVGVRREEQRVNTAKSRFLAAASHDLRQPLQTLVLLQGLLSRAVKDEQAVELVGQLGETLGFMSGMLNVLLDINRIEVGAVDVKPVDFRISDMLSPLVEEFSYHADAKGLELREIPCDLTVRSDPRLLAQMIRNLLSNAIKYTRRGRILVGCRRKGQMLSIEIWDTGIGIAANELDDIFEEYHQLDNGARTRELGLGLGLSILNRLGVLLGHKVRVRSRPGKGSVFTIEVEIRPDAPQAIEAEQWQRLGRDESVPAPPACRMLIVEDDPSVRDLLEMTLREDGYSIMTAADGPAALKLVREGAIQPDILVADYNLPNGLDGVSLAVKLRGKLNRLLPVVVLTGNMSDDVFGSFALPNSLLLTKPVKSEEIKDAVSRLVPATWPTRLHNRIGKEDECFVFLIDDDSHVCETIGHSLKTAGYVVETFLSAEDFLASFTSARRSCLIVDAYLPGMSGLDLLRQIDGSGTNMRSIVITGGGDVNMAVEAMKAGAIDFIEKPVEIRALLESVARAIELSESADQFPAARQEAAAKLKGLTPRQREILAMILAGHPNKNIAADLNISQRTVENHRAALMKRTGTKSLSALAHLAFTAGNFPNE